MTCHSRAANYLLGVTEPQLNKLHDYGGVTDNQLRTFEHLGLLRVNLLEREQVAYNRLVRLLQAPLTGALKLFGFADLAPPVLDRVFSNELPPLLPANVDLAQREISALRTYLRSQLTKNPDPQPLTPHGAGRLSCAG